MAFITCDKFNRAVNEINSKVDEKVGSLVDCNGNPIANGAALASCANLNDLKANAVKDLAIQGDKLKITMANGNKREITLPDGGVFTADLQGSNLILKDKNGNRLQTLSLASLIPAAKADRFLKSVVYNKSGKKLVFTIGADGEADTTLEAPLSDLLLSAVGNGIAGDGSATNPLTAKLGSGLKFDSNGAIELDRQVNVVTNLNNLEVRDSTNYLKKPGISSFKGYLGAHATPADVAIGLPNDLAAQISAPATTTRDESIALDATVGHDFSGFQVANGAEIIQYITIDGVRFFTRSNDYGLNERTGEVNDPTVWRDWKRIDNMPQDNSGNYTGVTHDNTLSGVGVSSSPLKVNIAGIAAGLADNETIIIENGKLKVKPKNCRTGVHTVNNDTTINSTDELLVVNSGNVTVPALEVGREVTVVQGGANKVTLIAGSGVRLVKPFGGSLSTAGENAAVTLIATERTSSGTTVVRVFGQTEAA